MIGMSATTGRALSGIDHVRQSVTDILTTPIGTRVMRRDYGSKLFELIDAPMNRETLLELYKATAEALLIWEPRLKVERVIAASAEPGRVELSLTGEYLPDGEKVTIDGVVVQ
jgi:phage baseplate assembly protein W